MKTQNMVTITLDEYKELLLKDKPTDTDKELVVKLFNVILPQLKYSDSSYRCVMENVEVEDASKVLKEIFTMLKYVDFEKYMSIWNSVMTLEKQRKQQEMTIKQMNDAKAIRQEIEKGE